jgi:hypothetical protein
LHGLYFLPGLFQCVQLAGFTGLGHLLQVAALQVLGGQVRFESGRFDPVAAFVLLQCLAAAVHTLFQLCPVGFQRGPQRRFPVRRQSKGGGSIPGI